MKRSFPKLLDAGLCNLEAKPFWHAAAAMLPAFIFLYEWYFFQHLSRAWPKKHLLHIGLALGFLVLLIFI